MAEECTESSSATPNWWPELHTGSLSSWSSNTNPWQPPNPNSNSSGEEDVSISTSFTNASNHSVLSVDSSRHLVESAPANEFIGETVSDNQIWRHVLLSVGSSGGELNNTREVRDNTKINMLSSKSSSIGMFEPACNYLKKLDSSWEFITNPPSINNFQKHFNGFQESLIESERPNKLSSMVGNWSIAPPDSGINHQFDARACNISLRSTMDGFTESDLCHMKQRASDSTPFGGNISRNSSSFSCYGHEQKVKDERPFRQPFNTSGSGIEYQIGLNNSIAGENSKYYYGMPDIPCTSTRSIADVGSFSSFLSKPSVDILESQPVQRSLKMSDCKKQGVQTSNSNWELQPTISTSHTAKKCNVRGQEITSEGKKKRSEENSEITSKKPKLESSSISSVKVQVPKVKLGEKITALQQIVSPFGKTDTASVLGEAIGYIKFLQEQVQLLSNPYIKTNSSKDSWGGMDRKNRGDLMFDLKSRGLCLVPISNTPQAYRENNGSDYWTPTYRGLLYR